MKTKFLILIIGAIIIVVLSAVLFFPKKAQSPINNNEPLAGIQISSPKPNDAVSSPLKITGYVNGDGWIGFEGQVGIVKLFDESGKQLALGILTAQGEWMQKVINFETTLWFDYPGEGTGKLVFYNENPSGEAERDKTFELPVKLQKSSAATSKFQVYFSSNDDVMLDCAKVLPFERQVPKTQAVARSALEELLKGPSNSEKNAGLFTSINSGVTVQSLVITNGIAKVDFNEALQQGVAGSCKVTAIRSQIEKTLLQFPTVKSVVISINGQTEDILQP